MSFVKPLLAFAPWISLLIIARVGLLRVKIGLAVALALSLVMGAMKLHRGIILWVGLFFFSCATIAVAVFNDIWFVRHLGVLATAALALSAWAGVVVGKPFTLDYAREHTDPAVWNQPDFIKSNILVTSIWAAAFTANAVLAWGKMTRFLAPERAYEAVSYALLVGAAAFTGWWQNRVRHNRRAP